jgi:hypothetical protein
MHSRTTTRPRLFPRALWLPAALIAMLALVAVMSPAEAATLNVDGTDVGCDDVAGAPYCTIQAAIDASLDGDIISVAAGTYDERLVIDKQVTLSGAGIGSSIVQPSDVPVGGGHSDRADIWLTTGASGTTIQGFTLDFNGAAGTRAGWGVLIGELASPAVTGVTIQNNRFEVGRSPGPGGCVSNSCYAITTGRNANISGLTISNNTFVTEGDQSAAVADRAIYINPMNGAVNRTTPASVVSITGNTFQGFAATPIAVEDATLISGNTLTGVANVHVTSHGIRVYRLVLLGSGPPNEVPDVGFSVIISNNTISGFDFGISAGLDSALNGTARFAVTISNNTISHNGTGINVVGDLVDVVASSNSITGNTIGAAHSGGTATADASGNWWGSADGPGGAGPGSGDPIEAGITMTNWCVNSACTALSDDTVPAPAPAPTTDTVETDGGVVVEVENEVTASASAQTDVVVETSSAQGTVQVTAPAGALPAGSTLSVAAVANLDGMLEQAEPPLNTSVLMAFVVRALDANGNRLTDNFAAPVTLRFELAAHAVPANALERTLVVAFWNGERWVEVEGEATRAADGRWTLTVSVMHFTLFAVMHQPDRGLLLPAPAFAGVSLTTWGGGPLTLLPPAKSYWLTAGGILVGYVPGALAFVNAGFLSHFPEGDIPAGTALLVVR